MWSLVSHFSNCSSGFVCFVLCMMSINACVSGLGFRPIVYPYYCTSCNLLLSGVKLLLLWVSLTPFSKGFNLQNIGIEAICYSCNLTGKHVNSIDQTYVSFLHALLPSWERRNTNGVTIITHCNHYNLHNIQKKRSQDRLKIIFKILLLHNH